MKINAITDKPQQLITAIENAFRNDILKTWKTVLNDKKEKLFSHTPEQWSERAMIKPQIKENMVTFQITWWSKNEEPDEATKGYITGRFTEILMVHFRENFEKLIVA